MPVSAGYFRNRDHILASKAPPKLLHRPELCGDKCLRLAVSMDYGEINVADDSPESSKLTTGSFPKRLEAMASAKHADTFATIPWPSSTAFDSGRLVHAAMFHELVQVRYWVGTLMFPNTLSSSSSQQASRIIENSPICQVDRGSNLWQTL